MKATSRHAVPIPLACDSQGLLEFAKVFPRTPTLNVQPQNGYRGWRSTPSLRRSRSRRLVNRANDSADDYHLDEATDAPVNDQLSGKRVDRVDGEAHANRRDLQ